MIRILYIISGYPARIFDAVVDKEIKMYLTEEIIDEYKDVLSRDYFKISREKIGRTINIVRKLGEIIIAETSDFSMEDEALHALGTDYIIG